MPVLKNVKVDNIENVTVIRFEKDLIFCEKEDTSNNIECCAWISDKDDGKLSTVAPHIDFILDFPEPAALRWFIEYLEKVEHTVINKPNQN